MVKSKKSAASLRKKLPVQGQAVLDAIKQTLKSQTQLMLLRMGTDTPYNDPTFGSQLKALLKEFNTRLKLWEADKSSTQAEAAIIAAAKRIQALADRTRKAMLAKGKAN